MLTLSFADKKTTIFSILVFACLLLAGCQTTPDQPITPIPTNSKRVTAAVTASVTPAPTGTSTAKPSVSPSPASLAEGEAGCVSSQGQVLPQTLAFPDMAQPLNVNIYLPPCFTEDAAEPYALLVLLHGQGQNQEQWLSLGLEQAANRLIISGQIPPLVILMPEEANSLQDPTQSGFPQLLLDGLLPWVQERWPVCSQPACRAVGGISRGGAWALRLGMDRADIFGVIGMHSAPPFPTDQYRLVYALYLQEENERPKLFIDVGDIDTYRSYILELHEDLLEQDIQHTWQTGSGGHEGAYWQEHLDDYLRWYGDALRAR